MPVLVAAALAVGCTAESDREVPRLPETRGTILISLDTLGAAHLGAYGYKRDTSPFLDALARRGVLFENAVVQYPSTLVSHMSLFSGLYPREHGVLRELKRLAAEIQPLPELMLQGGLSTGGFTEGGYVSDKADFGRGFEVFEIGAPGGRAVETTLAKGLEFLRRVGPEQRFFLFLHTYAVHPPYEPPEEYRELFWSEPEPADRDVSARLVRDVYMGRRTVAPGELNYLVSQYDGLVRYLDDSLSSFFEALEHDGRLNDTTVILTSDHGEEFLEHGALGHYQVYPQTLFVPLIVLHPGVEPGRRVTELVELVDLLPTLCDLSSIRCPEGLSGESLVPWLRASTAPRHSSREAWAEVSDQETAQTLIVQGDDRLYQVLRASRVGEAGGTWMSRSVRFDAEGKQLQTRMVSFARPRRVSWTVDGRERGSFEVGEAWSEVQLDLGGPGRHRVELSTDSCDVPMQLGRGNDSRCLSLKIAGVELARAELFDLTEDRWQAVDRSLARPELFTRLLERLDRRRFDLVAPPRDVEAAQERRDELRALGYID